jgi:hypothetical protein
MKFCPSPVILGNPAARHHDPLPRLPSNFALVVLMGHFVVAPDFAAGGRGPAARQLFPAEPPVNAGKAGHQRMLVIFRRLDSAGFGMALIAEEQRPVHRPHQARVYPRPGRTMLKSAAERTPISEPRRKEARSA